MAAHTDVRYSSNSMTTPMARQVRRHRTGDAEWSPVMDERKWTTRPVAFDQTAFGGASFDFASMIVAERLHEAERARLGAPVGPSLRVRIGRALVAFGTSVAGGAHVLRPASDTLPEPAAIAAGAPGAGGCS